MKCFITLATLLVLCIPAFAQTGDSSGPDQTINAPVISQIIAKPSVEADLTTMFPSYLTGKPVYFHFSVDNHSKEAVNYEFSSGQQYDVQVCNSAGTVVWTWSKGRAFGQLMTELSLGMGQTTDFTILWKQRDDNDHPVPPGVYTALATLIPMPRPIVSGNLLTNLNDDPANMGFPMMNGVQRGSVKIQNTTPAVLAKTTITVEPSPH